MDDEVTTLNLIARNGLRFPVGHSADAAAIAHATGAFVNPDPPYLQSIDFVLAAVLTATRSTLPSWRYRRQATPQARA